ncbi:MAG TPA: alpha/beta fold hydrolase, partial [Pirellulales bacterium]
MDAIRCLARAAAGAVVILVAVGLAAAGEFVEVAVPLREGCYYSPRDFAAQCNEQLRTHIPLRLISDKERKLTDTERRALLAADAAGILSARFADGQIVFRFRNPQDDTTRRHHRQLIEKYLGLSMAWPAERGLHLPADFLPAERTLLLIHGLESHADEFDRFQQACRAWGVQTIVFDYPNDGPIAWSGDRLSEDLQRLSARHPQLRVVIVAHSMGGLVARHALETPGKRPGCVTDLFTLGTPHAGTKYSDFQPVVELCRETFSKYALYGGTIRDGLGEAADDLHEGSEFLTTLNGRERPAGVTYHVAAGS